MRGSITIEAALVIPIVLLIVCSLMLLGLRYSDYVVTQSHKQLEEDYAAITGELRHLDAGSANKGVNYVDPKMVVRVADAIDDLTDMISITSDLKKNYSDFFDGIITGF